jgi:hypothetical protein
VSLLDDPMASCAELRSEAKRLREENARLRRERDRWRDLARRLYHLMGEEAESLLPGDLE